MFPSICLVLAFHCIATFSPRARGIAFHIVAASICINPLELMYIILYEILILEAREMLERMNLLEIGIVYKSSRTRKFYLVLCQPLGTFRKL